MLNSPIDDLREALNRVKEENEYIKDLLNNYKRIGQIKYQGLSSGDAMVGVRVNNDLILVEFGKKQLVLTPSDLLMLANLNGLFNNLPGGTQ